MGEAKRRKKLESNFGKVGKNQIEIKTDLDFVLPEDLNEKKQSLLEDGKIFFLGTITRNACDYPVIFIPYTRIYQGRLKLYSHFVFSLQNYPKLSQVTIDEISRQVSRQLIEKKLIIDSSFYKLMNQFILN